MSGLEIIIGKIRKKCDANSFLLDSAADGSYFLKSLCGLQSRFEGLFSPVCAGNDWDMFRVIEDVKLCAKPCGLELTDAGSIINYEGGASQQFSFSADGSLECKISGYCGLASIVVDMRPIYNFDNSDLHYDIMKNKANKKVLLCAKRKHPDLIDSYLRIESSMDLLLLSEWSESFYPFDKRRNSPPYSHKVNYMFNIEIPSVEDSLCLRFSFSDSLSEKMVVAPIKSDKGAKKHDFKMSRIADFTGLVEMELQQAFSCAEQGLKKLLVCPPGQKENGIFAGYPWFFHWWTRDEAFSLGAYLCRAQTKTAKKILFRQIEQGLDSGLISNRRPESDLASADGIGWCALRFFQLLSSGKIRAGADLQILADFFNEQLDKLEQHFLRNDLIWNAPFESWMDTGTAEDSRAGACLEIQCLHQRIQDLTFILARNMNGEVNYFDRRPIIKKQFFNGKCLADHIKNNGYVDNTQRPNIFLAAYILPDLLSKTEWKTCFDFALERIYCDWGGISSIEKDHKLFQPYYTGQNNLSYHRGDSWYWLNNIAALCLWRVNKKRYQSFISKILQASTHEILFSGALGYHAELSSAAEQSSDGCLSQAWSMAAYIELLSELQKYKA